MLETESITEYELTDEKEFGVTENVVQISETNRTFDDHSNVTKYENVGQDNHALDLKECPQKEKEKEQEKCGFTI